MVLSRFHLGRLLGAVDRFVGGESLPVSPTTACSCFRSSPAAAADVGSSSLPSTLDGVFGSASQSPGSGGGARSGNGIGNGWGNGLGDGTGGGPAAAICPPRSGVTILAAVIAAVELRWRPMMTCLALTGL